MTVAEPLPIPSTPQADFRAYARRLKDETCACRLSFSKLGTRKAMTREQRKKAAEPFGADHKALSASKKLIDTRDPAFRAVRQVLGRAKNHWKGMTTPYPEPGIRLIRKSAVEMFDALMKQCDRDLTEAVAKLQAKYPELKTRAAQSLAELFNEADYPSRIDSAFGLEWDFPSVDPPAYLKQLNPDLYEQECKKIEARFSMAVEQAEQAFITQFQVLVSHLAERLKGDVDGKPKVFRDSAVANLNAFFEQFRSLDIGSNSKLQELIGQAQIVVQGITADRLREDGDARASIQTALAQVEQSINELMVDRPQRGINFDLDG